MKERKIPMRTCAVTNLKEEKRNLIRVVRTPEGEVVVDTTEHAKLNGRGVYVTKSIEVVDKAEKSKVLEKRLEVSVPSSIYTDLRNIINNSR